MTKESPFLHDRLTATALPAQRLDRFERLVRQYEPVVYAVCRMLTPDESEASLSCEDAFVEAYRSPQDLTINPARFLCTTMRLAMDRVNAAPPPRPLLIAPGMDAHWANLPLEDRNILALRFAGRLEIAEVGQVLCLPIAAVRARLWAAMRNFGGRLLGTN